MPSVQQEEGHVLLQSHMTCHIIVAISKSNWFYTVNRSDQLGAVSVEFSFFDCNNTGHTAGYFQKGTSTLSHTYASQSSWIESDNQKIGECRKIVISVLTRTTSCTPSKVKCKRLKPLGFFFKFFFAAIAFPLNNNICLFVFSECFQITHWRLLDHMHLQFQQMTYQCRFSKYQSIEIKENDFFLSFFFTLFSNI